MEAGLSEEEKAMELLIHTLLIRYFSSVERPVRAVLTGDEVLLNQVIQYVGFFYSENLIFSLPISRSNDYNREEFRLAFAGYIQEMGMEIRNKCNLLLVDYCELNKRETFFLSELNEILDYKGKVIIYHGPEKKLEYSGFLLEEKFIFDKSNTVYLLESNKQYRINEEEEKIISQYENLVDKLSIDWIETENLAITTDYEKDRERLTIKLDIMISLVQKLEVLVLENVIFQWQENLRFEINEVKNALLDLSLISRVLLLKS